MSLYAVALLVISAVQSQVLLQIPLSARRGAGDSRAPRLFDWLRRRKECGRPCQICANECEVQAISATGEINANECHYCLDCQVTYWNDTQLPAVDTKAQTP